MSRFPDPLAHKRDENKDNYQYGNSETNVYGVGRRKLQGKYNTKLHIKFIKH